MKLTHINEAMRFGSREFRQIEKMANRIKIGIEYEFHVDKDAFRKAQDEEEFERKVKEETDKILAQNRDYFRGMMVNTVVQDEFGELVGDFKNYHLELEDAIERVFAGIDYNLAVFGNKIIKLLRYKDYTITGMREAMESGEIESQEYWDWVTDVSAMSMMFPFFVEKFVPALKPFDDPEYDPHFYHFYHNGSKNITPELKQRMEERHETMAYLIQEKDELVQLIGDPDQLKITNAKVGAEGAWDNFKKLDHNAILDTVASFLGARTDGTIQQFNRFDIQEIEKYVEENFGDVIDRMHEARWDEDEARGDAEVDARRQLEASERSEASLVSDDYDDDPRVFEVTTDPSVSQGVELITKPLKLPDAMKFMEEMFEYISEHGHTSEKTGMHVNLSIDGMTFDRNSFSPAKVVMLLDEDYLRRDDKIVKYPVRNYVDKMLASVTVYQIVMAMEHTIMQGNEYIAKAMENLIDSDTKYQSITFRNTFDAYEADQRRIEFRFFGGENYEKRFVEMRKDIYRVAYAVLAGFSDKFAQDDYVRAILRFFEKKIRAESKNVYGYYDVLNFLKTEPDLSPARIARSISLGVDIHDIDTPKPQLP